MLEPTSVFDFLPWVLLLVFSLWLYLRSAQAARVRKGIEACTKDASTKALAGEPTTWFCDVRFNGLGGLVWPQEKNATVSILAVRHGAAERALSTHEATVAEASLVTNTGEYTLTVNTLNPDIENDDNAGG